VLLYTNRANEFFRRWPAAAITRGPSVWWPHPGPSSFRKKYMDRHPWCPVPRPAARVDRHPDLPRSPGISCFPGIR